MVALKDKATVLISKSELTHVFPKLYTKICAIVFLAPKTKQNLLKGVQIKIVNALIVCSMIAHLCIVSMSCNGMQKIAITEFS